MKRIVQVKYCYTEEELNEFLKTLNFSTLSDTSPTLFNIQYMANMHGDGVEKHYADNEGIIAKVTIGNDIIAMVQYIVTEEGEL